MSQENVEVVQAAFRAYERGDMEGVLRLCDENIEITQPAELPGVSRRQHGHAGVLEAFAIWPEQWDDFRVEILRAVDMGDQVLVTTLQGGRGKESGVPVETRFSFLFSVRTGKIAEWRLFMREEDALEATS
ncbi:MAG: nuclear transport factor 2 family protein [Actinomycetota bacterium]|nr:nuclear transport factor 2 family protein [Actinomycetota bacterium]